MALIGVLGFSLAGLTRADSATGSTFTVTKTATPSTAGVSSPVSFTISIKNNTTVNTAPQTVTDTLPEGFVFLNDAKLTTLDGSQVDFAPTAAGQVLTWNFDAGNLQSIPQDENIVIAFSATSPATAATYTNQACLTVPENVCASAQVVVQAGTPQAGLVDNILIALGLGSVLILIGRNRFKNYYTFERKLENKRPRK